MFQQTRLRSLLFLASMSGLIAYASWGGVFARELVVEIVILAILAVSLDVVAGFGGMVSLGHGALMGLAAYAYGVASVKLGLSGWAALPFAFVATAIFGTAVAGLICNLSGVFFIMASLAFGQMAYVVVFKSPWFGGDDGISGVPRLDAKWLGLDLANAQVFAIAAVIVLALVYLAAALVMRSGFGRTLAGIHINEQRMRALGVNTWRIKICAFGFSAFLAASAGIISAQHTRFISPELLFWTVSGEILIVAILGGIGTLIGPLVGAILFVLLKHQISSYTDRWHAIIGLILIASVLAGGRGLWGQIEYFLSGKRGGDA